MFYMYILYSQWGKSKDKNVFPYGSYILLRVTSGFPQWLNGKESTYNVGAAGDVGSIPGFGILPGGEHGNPLQYSCLENPMDRGAWWASVHRVPRSQT